MKFDCRAIKKIITSANFFLLIPGSECPTNFCLTLNIYTVFFRVVDPDSVPETFLDPEPDSESESRILGH
jgi:hypothetical protein